LFYFGGAEVDRGVTGYVWAFTNMDAVFYLFQKTREGNILKKILSGFEGVLLSDSMSISKLN
jgi:hypothetical protein